MKSDQRGKPMFFRAGSAPIALSSAIQRGYFNNSRDDPIKLGKEGFLAISESMSMMDLISWHNRETDKEIVANYCITDAP